MDSRGNALLISFHVIFEVQEISFKCTTTVKTKHPAMNVEKKTWITKYKYVYLQRKFVLKEVSVAQNTDKFYIKHLNLALHWHSSKYDNIPQFTVLHKSKYKVYHHIFNSSLQIFAVVLHQVFQ